MPFSKSELIDLANQCASELGRPPISESCLEGWVTRKLLDRAHARGIRRGVNPNWSYPDSAVERVKLIVALQALGATRTSQLIVCLWLLGASFPPHRIGEALKSELRRLVKRQERGPPWWKDHYTAFERLSATERAKRSNQLPKLDSALAATPFALPPETYHQIGLRAYWGTDDGLGITALIFGCESGHQYKASVALPPHCLLPIEIAGALGPPDESANGGYDVLGRVDGFIQVEGRGIPKSLFL
jgi:hypothetical protein